MLKFLSVAQDIDWTRCQIEMLDLDPIKIKLMDSKEGEGWSRTQVDEVEREYKRFMYLVAKYPSRSIVPTKLVDKFWHAHILDTQKYEKDCDDIFGHFVHHFPYFGMRSAEDAQDLERSFAESNALYLAEFNMNASIVRADCESPGSCNAKCNAKCSARPSKCTPPNCDSRMEGVRPSLQENRTAPAP